MQDAKTYYNDPENNDFLIGGWGNTEPVIKFWDLQGSALTVTRTGSDGPGDTAQCFDGDHSNTGCRANYNQAIIVELGA